MPFVKSDEEIVLSERVLGNRRLGGGGMLRGKDDKVNERPVILQSWISIDQSIKFQANTTSSIFKGMQIQGGREGGRGVETRRFTDL